MKVEGGLAKSLLNPARCDRDQDAPMSSHQVEEYRESELLLYAYIGATRRFQASSKLMVVFNKLESVFIELSEYTICV